MKIKGILFDLDGTLLDTTDGVIESVYYTVARMGLKRMPYEIMLKFVGPPIQQSFIKYYDLDANQAQIAANYFRDYYKEKALLKAVPYNEIYELCDYLKKNKIKMAVATYKREDYALKLLQYFGFDQYFDVMHGADNENKLSKSDIVNMCIKEMKINKDNCVLIGDTEHDAMGAKNAKIRFIGVTYGFGFKNKEDVDCFDNIGHVISPIKIIDYV